MINTNSNKIKIIEQSPTMVLWDLLQGILDPEKENENSRHACPHSRGRTCWIDIFQYVLHGSSPDFNNELKKTNSVINSFRIQSNQDRIATKLAGTGKRMLSNPSYKLDIECVEENANTLINLFKSDRKFDIELELMQGFCNQNETLLFKKYLFDLIAKEGIKTHEIFFEGLETNPLSLIPAPILEVFDKNNYKNIREYPIQIQYSLIANVASKALIAQKYKLSASSWNPSKGIDLLFEEVKKHGVIGFGGLFGKNLYTASPRVVLKINNYDIYGWKGSERRTDYATGHYIAVVGVKKGTSAEKMDKGQAGYIIYIDPVDGTDPQNPGQRKLYIIPYSIFIENVSNEFNMRVKPEKFKQYETKLLERYPSLKPFAFGLLPNPPYIE